MLPSAKAASPRHSGRRADSADAIATGAAIRATRSGGDRRAESAARRDRQGARSPRCCFDPSQGCSRSASPPRRARSACVSASIGLNAPRQLWRPLTGSCGGAAAFAVTVHSAMGTRPPGVGFAACISISASCAPRAASARDRPSRCAPCDRRQSRPAGSATGIAHDGSPSSSSRLPERRHRLGCTLCTLGASRASATSDLRRSVERSITMRLRAACGTDATGAAASRRAFASAAGSPD